MKTTAKLLAGVATAGIFLAAMAPAAFAQTAPAQDPDEEEDGAVVEEVVVTAQRRSERAVDVPISLTTYTGEELEDRNITDLAALQAVTPGLEVQPSAGGGALAASSSAAAAFMPP